MRYRAEKMKRSVEPEKDFHCLRTFLGIMRPLIQKMRLIVSASLTSL